MTNVFRNIFRAALFPFALFYRILATPFILTKRAWKFLASDSKESYKKEVWDHVEDLRGHLLRIVLCLTLTVGVSFYFTLPLMEYLARPVGGLPNLQAIEVTEEIGVFMRVALTSGFIISLPYIAFEFWWFAAKGLSSREKRYTLLIIPTASFLFVLGVAFTYFVLIPAALPFLGSFTAISQFWAAKEYFGFITSLMTWIGVFFEFPLVIFALSYLGAVSPATLTQQWRAAIVVIAIVAAAVTPTVDPVNMGLVMLPMILLYFASIGLSHLAAAMRRRSAPQRQERKSEPEV
ncbi:MAG: twin-arginine translocase subunit TatC [Anaerolineales bacterium]|nr:twin-arginine translocase subunit TatC [Anaerolineales bacterium]